MPWRADFSTVPPPIQPHISNKPRSFAENSPLPQHPLVDLDIIWSFLCSSKGGLLIDQVNICCTINVMGCTRLQCFATFRHEFSCQSVVTGGAGWLVYPSSPWYHGTAFIVNMVPWYSVHSHYGIMVLYGMVGTPIIVPPLFPQLSREMVLGSIVPTIVPSVVPTYQ